MVGEDGRQRQNSAASVWIDRGSPGLDVIAVNRDEGRGDLRARLGHERRQRALAALNLLVDERVELFLHGGGDRGRELRERFGVLGNLLKRAQIHPTPDEVAELNLGSVRLKEAKSLAPNPVRIVQGALL